MKVTLSVILLALVLFVFASYVTVTGGETFIGLLLIVSLNLTIVHVVVLVGGHTVFNRLFFVVLFNLMILIAFYLRASFISLLVILLGHLIITGFVTILTII